MEKLREMEVARQEIKRKAFEKLPEVADSLSEHIVFIGNKYTTPNQGFYDLVNWLNGAWYAWQAAQEQMLQAIHKDQLNFTGEALSLAKLVPSDECTHAVINGTHYEFVDFQVFDDIESCLLKHVGFTEKGINSIIINNFAVIRELQDHKIEKLKLKLGIDEVNYDSKQ